MPLAAWAGLSADRTRRDALIRTNVYRGATVKKLSEVVAVESARREAGAAVVATDCAPHEPTVEVLAVERRRNAGASLEGTHCARGQIVRARRVSHKCSDPR